MNQDDRFLKREYLRNLFPIVFSILGGTVNTLIDSVFVSQKLGNPGLAAVTLCMPVYLLLCTLGSLTAAGASLLSAQAVGRERMDEAAGYYHSALTLCAAAGLLFTLVGVGLCGAVTKLLSRDQALRRYVHDYILVTMLGTLPLMLSYLPQYYLQLEGKMREIVHTMLLLIGLDFFFDWLFLYRFGMEMQGAALASLTATVIAGLYSYPALARGYSNYHAAFRRPSLRETALILRAGSPTALSNLLDCVKLFLLNTIIFTVGGIRATAVWAVLNTLLELSVALTSGIPQAADPMMGAYCAAGENGGLRILVRLQIKYGMFLAVLFAMIPMAARETLEAVFGVAENMSLPFLCMGIYVMADLPCSIWAAFCHATGRIGLSDFLVSWRKFLAPVSAALAVGFSGMPLWIFLPVGGVLALFAAYLGTAVCRRGRKEGAHALSPVLLLDDYLEKEKKVLDFSIAADRESICRASEQIQAFCAQNHMSLKQTMQIELAIEELLVVLVQRDPHLQSVDLRAFSLEGTTGIRIRFAGKRYDPFAPHPASENERMLGVDLLKKMARDIEFVYAFGMNSILISFGQEQRKEG